MMLPAAYLWLRVLRPLPWARWWKAAAALPMLAAALRATMLRLWGGSSTFAPDVPPWLLYTSAGLLAAYLIYFCGAAGLHLLQGAALRWLPLWRRATAESQQHCLNTLHLLLLPAALLLSALGVWGGLALPQVRHVTLPFPTDEPLRIALISDLHVCVTRSDEMVQHIVRLTNAQHPDAIFLVGDFADGLPAACGSKLAPLRELRAPLGVYGVSGNHDYYADYKQWHPFLTQLGIRMLENEHVQLRPQGPVLAGVTDESALRVGLPSTYLPAALRGAPPEQPIILLAHRPIVAREAAPAGVRLQLSGHLHGGLVWGLGTLIAALDAGYRAGLYHVGDMQLYVTTGAGSSARTPLRLGVPTEIVLITLTPQGA